MFPELEPLWEKAELKRKSRKGRKRRIGGGIKAKLTLAQKPFMLPLYYRTYTNHIFIGPIAGIDDGNVGRNINPLGLCRRAPPVKKLMKSN